MKVTRLELTMFRNYRSLELEPGGGLSLLIGANAQGKTNLLEAIALLMRGRSHRIRTRQDILTRGERLCRAAARLESAAGVSHDVSLTLQRTGARQMSLDGQKLERTSQLFERLPCVLQETTDLEMLSGAPSGRRDFLDMLCLELSVRHVEIYSRYQHMLRSRNALLARGRGGAEMETVESQMGSFAGALVAARIDAVDALRRELDRLPPSHDEEVLEIRYGVNGVAGGEDVPDGAEERASWYARELAGRRDVDQGLGYSSFGPHRDDLVLTLGGTPVRNVASRGQQRDMLLRLKVAEALAVGRRRGEMPVMLLDDVFSETDRARRKHMLGWLPREAQIFLSGTDERIFEEMEHREWRGYRVTRGQLVAA